MTVVTRFAPSPTGYLHIGGARTALFNWLYARHTGGKFLLRIEDTDRARSTEAAMEAIIDGMEWLGLDWDGEIIYQFSRMERHAEVAQQLLDEGKAYKCYCSPAELEEMRAKAKAEGRGTMYDNRWRDRDPSEAPKDVKPVIRIKAPLDGETVVNDLVQGEVRVANTQLDDFILLRSDGTPTYMLSVVVDDHDMDITHVIRGDDHLNNTFRQKVIYDAMGWDLPVFGHVPMIHGPDGGKLSKRHGALGVDAYRDMGYLPEAMRNYLLRLGWSHGNDEIISTEQAVEWFELDGIGKSPSRFDFTKLDSLNAHYIKESGEDALIDAMMPFLTAKLDGAPDETGIARLKQALPELRERVKNIVELTDNSLFIFKNRPLDFDEKAAKVLDDGTTREMLGGLKQNLSNVPNFDSEAIEATIRDFSEQNGLKLGKVAMPFRAAITGTTNTPSIFHIAEILGREETLARLDDIAAA